MKPHLYRKGGYWFCRLPDTYGVVGGLATPLEAYQQYKLYTKIKI